MNPLKRFDEFINLGKVKKQRPNLERANSLIKESKEKKYFFEKVINSMPFSEVSPNYIVETCYDILIELVRAKMFKDGFNSGNSHEAEVSYMRDLNFCENDVRFMNELRYFRNKIKYYGKIFDFEYAKKVMEFMERSVRKLRQN